MKIRKPAVAGQFYPATQAECLQEIQECLDIELPDISLPQPIVGGIVPHAGWVFSGRLAAMVFKAIQQMNRTVDTFLLFGASHRYSGRKPAVWTEGDWETPLGIVGVDKQFAAQLVDFGAVDEPTAHLSEHSIEVQVPFIQYLFSDARIVPVVMPVWGFDAQWCGQIAELVRASGKSIVSIGSTDLTHYGPRYGFCPQGTGKVGLDWAYQVNDQAFIDLALALKAEQMVQCAVENENACGPAAAAAVAAIAATLGRQRGILLAHTHSNMVMRRRFGYASEESVGYAAIVY